MIFFKFLVDALLATNDLFFSICSFNADAAIFGLLLFFWVTSSTTGSTWATTYAIYCNLALVIATFFKNWEILLFLYNFNEVYYYYYY